MTTTQNIPPLFPPAMAAAELQRLAAAELSLPARLGYVALLLVSLIMTSIIGSLWVTEPWLPLRTQVAFGVMIAIAVSWAVFAVWALKNRRVLFAHDRVVAGRMAVTFTSVFVIGALAVSYATGARAAYAASITGLVMLAAAAVMLVRAHRTYDRLHQRRRKLEQELGMRAQ